MGAGQLPGNDHMVILDQTFNGNSRFRIVLQAVRYNRIGDESA
jgi:hypothetical protein